MRTAINPIHAAQFHLFATKVKKLMHTDNAFVVPRKSGAKKDVLFLAGTHGDERLSVELMSKLGNGARHDWLLANEKAAAIRTAEKCGFIRTGATKKSRFVPNV